MTGAVEIPTVEIPTVLILALREEDLSRRRGQRELVRFRKIDRPLRERLARPRLEGDGQRLFFRRFASDREEKTGGGDQQDPKDKTLFHSYLVCSFSRGTRSDRILPRDHLYYTMFRARIQDGFAEMRRGSRRNSALRRETPSCESKER